MRHRPVRAAAGAFGALAAAAGLLAAPGMVGSVGAGVADALTPGGARVATSPGHVAVVVDYLGQRSTACAPAGGTGLDVLTAEFAVRFGSGVYTGFVLQIDGHGTLRPDNTHYWSYWHDTGHGWAYASTGGAGSRPAAGTVEGWSYVDGASAATPPPTTSYASVCAGQDRPAPARTSNSSTPHKAHTSTTAAAPRSSAPRSAPASTRAAPDAVASSTATGRPARLGSTAPGAHPSSSAAPSSAVASAPTTAAVPTASASAVDDQASIQPATAATGSDTSGGPGAGTMVGIALVLALGAGGGGLTWWRRTRRGAG